MYELRELGDNYFGHYLILALVLLVSLKLFNSWRLKSLMHFWNRVGHTEEFNKPFKLSRYFSILAFVLRSLVFGLILKIIKTKSFYISNFDGEVLYFACGFIVFWAFRVLVEGIFMSFFKKQATIFRLFYIRTLNKEKMSFFYGCLLFGLAFVGFGEITSIIFACSYVIILLVIHINMIKLYFEQLNAMHIYIIMYICASEIAPLWLVLQILKF